MQYSYPLLILIFVDIVRPFMSTLFCAEINIFFILQLNAIGFTTPCTFA